MNIILLEASEVKGGLVCIEGRRAVHIVKVLRAHPGDVIKIGIINGKIGEGTIKSITSKPCGVTMSVQCIHAPPSEPNIDVLLALPRPIMLKRILCHLATLGVGQVMLVNAARVEKSFWESSLLVEDQWRDHFLLGLEQAVDTVIPRLTKHRGFKPFVEHVLPQIAKNYNCLLLAHPNVEYGLRHVMTGVSGRVLLAIGPEGGWSDYEIDGLEQAGFKTFSIGPRILRVETAVTALHAMVSLFVAQGESEYQRVVD